MRLPSLPTCILTHAAAATGAHQRGKVPSELESDARHCAAISIPSHHSPRFYLRWVRLWSPRCVALWVPAPYCAALSSNWRRLSCLSFVFVAPASSGQMPQSSSVSRAFSWRSSHLASRVPKPRCCWLHFFILNRFCAREFEVLRLFPCVSVPPKRYSGEWYSFFLAVLKNKNHHFTLYHEFAWRA